MDKKDIYEHLAKIYLDASTGKKKSKKKKANFSHLIPAAAILLLALAFGLPRLFHKSKYTNSETTLVLQSEVSKINFNFDPAKKEIYSIKLNKLNAARFKSLGISIKKQNYNDKVSLKIEVVNSYKEKSDTYLKDLSNKWQDYTIDLSNFKGITDWSEVTGLSLIVEEWNTSEKNGVIYVDNVRLLR